MRPTAYGIQLEDSSVGQSRSLHRYRECARCGMGVRPTIATGIAPIQRSVNRYLGCAPVWPGQAPDAAWGKRPMRPRQTHCQQLGMRPVTLRRISQHPPVTSKLGLSSRLALPANFHRQPGCLMCGLLNKINYVSVIYAVEFSQGNLLFVIACLSYRAEENKTLFRPTFSHSQCEGDV